MKQTAVFWATVHHVINADVLGIVAVHPACVGHVKAALIGAERQTIRAGHIRNHRRNRAVRVDAVDLAGQFLRGAIAFVVGHYPVMRVGEPDAAVAGGDHVIGTVERLAIKTVGQHCHAAIPFGPRHAARAMFATDQSPHTVAGMAVGVVRRLAKRCQPLFGPAQDAVVGDIGKEQAAHVTEPDRPFDPVKAGGQPLWRRIAQDIAGEQRIENFIKRHCHLHFLARWYR